MIEETPSAMRVWGEGLVVVVFADAEQVVVGVGCGCGRGMECCRLEDSSIKCRELVRMCML